MNQDNLFKFSFFFMLLLMTGIFSSNIEKSSPQLSQRKEQGNVINEIRRVDIERLKKLINEGKLSDKEALFYKAIEQGK